MNETVEKLRALLAEAKVRHAVAARRAAMLRDDAQGADEAMDEAHEEAYAYWRALRALGDEATPDQLDLVGDQP